MITPLCSKSVVAVSLLLCLAVTGCELSDRVVPGGADAQAGKSAKPGATVDDDPISRAREAQEAAAAQEVADSQLRAQAGDHDPPPM